MCDSATVDGFGKKGLNVKVGCTDSYGSHFVKKIHVDSSACATNNTKFSARITSTQAIAGSDVKANCDTTSADTIVETNARVIGYDPTGKGYYKIEKKNGAETSIQATCTLPGKTTVLSMESEAKHLVSLLNSGWNTSYFEPKKCKVIARN
jgi:hypothetical protein